MGDKVEIIAIDDKIIIQPETKKIKYRLEDLVARIPEGYKSTGEEITSSVGKEEW